MTARTAKLFTTGRSQAVRLPAEFRFEGREVFVPAVTEGELLFGLARRGYPNALTERVRQFLLRVDVLPWDSDAARGYADLRAACQAQGVGIAPLDMMIAGHAVAADAVLVSR